MLYHLKGETVIIGDTFTSQYKWSMEKQNLGFCNVVSEQLKIAFSFINIITINNNYNFVCFTHYSKHSIKNN